MATSENSPQIVPPVDASPAAPGPTGSVNPTALTPAQLARMLAVPEDTIRRHLEDGAPAGVDGTINLVQYAAWLNKRLVTAEPEAQPDAD